MESEEWFPLEGTPSPGVCCQLLSAVCPTCTAPAAPPALCSDSEQSELSCEDRLVCTGTALQGRMLWPDRRQLAGPRQPVPASPDCGPFVQSLPLWATPAKAGRGTF